MSVIELTLIEGYDEPTRIRLGESPTDAVRSVIDAPLTVLENGFEYQGLPYKSLSAIARAITGTRWNGWTFFGVKNRARP